MLRLKSETDPRWADRALAALDELLVDHAHCEKKAASMALTLMFRYPERSELLRPLSALAREELEHFEQVLAHIEARGRRFRKIGTGGYAARLLKVVRSGEPARLLDTLLCCAVIEARSCERMKLLAENLEDPKLAGLYRSLLASEARHHHGYVEMAMERFGRDVARARLAELAAHEAEVLATPGPVLRMHS